MSCLTIRMYGCWSSLFVVGCLVPRPEHLHSALPTHLTRPGPGVLCHKTTAWIMLYEEPLVGCRLPSRRATPQHSSDCRTRACRQLNSKGMGNQQQLRKNKNLAAAAGLLQTDRNRLRSGMPNSSGVVELPLEKVLERGHLGGRALSWSCD